jgi:FAD binding domain/Berberine and berberine like
MLPRMTLAEIRPTTITDAPAVRSLQARLLGEVIQPQDQAYDSARQVWNKAIDRYPSAIVRAADAADVIRSVEFARERNLPLSIRSGGHSFAGYGTVDGGMVLDLSQMQGLSLDAEHRSVWAQPGARTAELGPEASKYGLALPTGDVASVGLGGLTLGGGIGWLVRKHGLTIDHLQSVEMVTADGQLITASRDEHPDLFWALRGGGGNFGVVTGFEFGLADVGNILGGALVLPPTREVLEGYLSYAIQAPEELTTISVIMPAPPLPIIPTELHGMPVLMIMVVYAGDVDQGQRALAPLRQLAAPFAEMVAPMPYHGIYALTAAGAQGHPSVARSGFFDALDGEALDAMVAAGQNETSPGAMIQFRPLGGAMARVPAGETAFAHRQRNYMVTVASGWMAPEQEIEQRNWVESLWSQLRPKSNGVYSNFLGDEGETRIRQAYPGSTFERLVAVKRQYDPTNVFRLNQNIRP